MIAVVLFAAFETALFPAHGFFEARFNPAFFPAARYEIAFSSDRRFGLSEMNTRGVACRIGQFFANAASFGGDLYRENRLGFGYGFDILKNLRAGLDIALLNYRIRDYCSRYAFAVKTGLFFRPRRGQVGLWVNNINRPRFSAVDNLPLAYAAGISYPVSARLDFDFSVRGLEYGLPFYNYGLSYAPFKALAVDAAINSQPRQFEYGFDLRLGRISLYYAGTAHLELGLSHSISIIFAKM